MGVCAAGVATIASGYPFPIGLYLGGEQAVAGVAS